jgi:predicted nucleotidyltransferase
MFKHHQDTINNVIKKMKENSSVLALIIGGSIVHGFAKEDSDVDIMIVVSEEEYETKYRENNLTYWEKDSCTYENGYVDGKYISMDFMKKVSKHGSEAARFAFKDAFVAYSKIEGVEQILQEITRYPKELKADKMKRFLPSCMHGTGFILKAKARIIPI